MIILSVDYGDVRTGIAVCDKNEMLASPVTVIKQADTQKLCAKIAEICKQYKAEMIVCGLPKNMDGSSSYRVERTHRFASLLSEATGLEVDFMDERLSTMEAYTYLNITEYNGIFSFMIPTASRSKGRRRSR